MKRDVVYGLVIAVLLMLWWDSCSRKNETIDDTVSLVNYKDTVEHYKTKLGREVAINESLVMSEKDARHAIDSLSGFIKDLQFKKPSQIIRTVEILRIDSIPVPFDRPLPCDEFTMIKRIDTTWYSFNLRLTKHSLTFTDMEFPNKQEVIVGLKKNGLFKRPEYSVAVVNSNPYMHVESIGALTITAKPKFYNRVWFKLITHVAAFYGGTRINR